MKTKEIAVRVERKWEPDLIWFNSIKAIQSIPIPTKVWQSVRFCGFRVEWDTVSAPKELRLQHLQEDQAYIHMLVKGPTLPIASWLSGKALPLWPHLCAVRFSMVPSHLCTKGDPTALCVWLWGYMGRGGWSGITHFFPSTSVRAWISLRSFFFSPHYQSSTNNNYQSPVPTIEIKYSQRAKAQPVHWDLTEAG